MRIACLGGAHFDAKAHLAAAPRMGTSNPARVTRSPGGVACNVARSLARLGADVVLCSVTGDDPEGAALRAVLSAEGVDTGGLATDPDHPTASYLAVLDPEGALVLGVAAMGVYDVLGAGWAEEAARRAAGADLWVVDANLPASVLAALAADAPAPVVADPVSVAKAARLVPVLGRLEAVFPDRAEAEVLAGSADGGPAEWAAAIAAAGARRVVVSLGADGALAHEGGALRSVPAVVPVRTADVTGAGDALVAGYAHALAAGESDPLAWGMAAASLAVESDESVPHHLTAAAVRNRLPS